jgi:excisionase family DNA binding protein
MIESPWMTKTQGAQYLGVSTSTFDRYVRKGRLVKHYPGGVQAPRYRREQLDALLEPQTPKTK